MVGEAEGELPKPPSSRRGQPTAAAEAVPGAGVSQVQKKNLDGSSQNRTAAFARGQLYFTMTGFDKEKSFFLLFYFISFVGFSFSVVFLCVISSVYLVLGVKQASDPERLGARHASQAP